MIDPWLLTSLRSFKSILVATRRIGVCSESCVFDSSAKTPNPNDCKLAFCGQEGIEQIHSLNSITY